MSAGPAYIVASAFAFSVMAVFVKLAGAELALGQMVFFRAAATLVLSAAMVRAAGKSFRGNNRKQLLARGFIGFGGLTCYYATLGLLPLAHATLIQNATPVVTAVLSYFLIGEQVRLRVAIAIALGVGGVALAQLWHPADSASLSSLGIAVAITGTVFSSLAYITVRQLTKTDDPLVIVMYFPLIATPLALPWAIATWRWPSLTTWGYVAGFSVSTQLGQVWMTKGLARLTAARATALGYIQMLFAVGWSVAIFGEPVHVGIGLGLLLVGAAVVLVALPTKNSSN